MNTKLKKHPHPRPDQEVSPPEPRSKASEHKESTLPDALKVVDGAAKKITEFQDKVDTIESKVHDEITTVKDKLSGFDEVKELLDNSMGWIKKLSKKYVKDQVPSGNKIGSNNFWGHLALYFVQIFSIMTALDLFTDVESIIKVALASGSVILIGSIKAWAQQAINKQKKQSDSIRSENEANKVALSVASKENSALRQNIVNLMSENAVLGMKFETVKKMLKEKVPDFKTEMLDKIDVQKFKSKISADNPMPHGQSPPEIPPKDTPNPDPKVQNRKKETSNPPKDLNLNLT